MRCGELWLMRCAAGLGIIALPTTNRPLGPTARLRLRGRRTSPPIPATPPPPTRPSRRAEAARPRPRAKRRTTVSTSVSPSSRLPSSRETSRRSWRSRNVRFHTTLLELLAHDDSLVRRRRRQRMGRSESYVAHHPLVDADSCILTELIEIVSVVDLFNNLNLFYSVVTEFCTVENNPTMSAGPG